jgi:hypothetical protein
MQVEEIETMNLWSILMKQFIGMTLVTLGGLTQAGAETIDFEGTFPTYFGLITYNEDGFALTSNVLEGTNIDVNIDVTSLPIPAALWLFGSGLGLLLARLVPTQESLIQFSNNLERRADGSGKHEAFDIRGRSASKRAGLS